MIESVLSTETRDECRTACCLSVCLSVCLVCPSHEPVHSCDWMAEIPLLSMCSTYCSSNRDLARVINVLCGMDCTQ